MDRPFLNWLRLVAALQKRTVVTSRSGREKPRCIPLGTTFLIFCVFSCEPQRVSSRGGTGASFLLAHQLLLPLNRCAKSSWNAAVPRADPEVAGDAPSSCGALSPATPAPGLCDATKRAGTGCEDAQDLEQANLEAMGKAGQKISRAREKVLEILGAENACSAWLREKDANPAATFRTLRFELDL